jgi:Na+/melibiose symporter-like transporter
MEPERHQRVNAGLSFTPFQGSIRMLMGALITFLVVILILYLINLLPLDGRAKQIARVVVIVLGVISLLKYIAVF